MINDVAATFVYELIRRKSVAFTYDELKDADYLRTAFVKRGPDAIAEVARAISRLIVRTLVNACDLSQELTELLPWSKTCLLSGFTATGLEKSLLLEIQAWVQAVAVEKELVEGTPAAILWSHLLPLFDVPWGALMLALKAPVDVDGEALVLGLFDLLGRASWSEVCDVAARILQCSPTEG